MYGGIDQLVDTYKGNPQPLQSKVQKAQQSQPPGEVPPDLEEALALQEIAELRQGAQNQQAMQAGGAQQSVVDKLKQMLGGMRQQAQMAQAPQQPSQGQPVMAARGGSIDQLMSNLGRYYAGGGIVAFDGTKGSEVEDKKAKQREEDRRALLEPLAAVGDIAQLPIAAGYNLAADTGSGLERFLNRIGSALTGKEVNTQTDDQVGNKFRFSPTPFTDMLRKPTEREVAEKQAQTAAAALDPETQKLLNLAASKSKTGVNTNPDLVPRKPVVGVSPDDAKPRPAGAPGAGGAGKGGGAATQNVDPDSLDAITRKYLKGEFAVNPETERDKAVNWARQTMGLDALLGEKERRANEREAMIKQVQSGRTPAWVEGLIAAGKPVRGGLGSLLGQMGNAAQGTREGYQAQDLAFQKELAQLRDVITDAKIAGNKDLVKEGMAAYKEVDARRRAAAQSAASLLNTDANNAARIQQANITAQARRDARQQEASYKLEKLKQGERALDIKIAQAGITAQRPAIDAAAKEAKMQRMIYEALKDKNPEKAAAALDNAEQAQHRIDMILAPLSGIAGSSPAAAATGKPAPSTGGAKFLGFEPSKS